jgi:glutaredoxin
VNGPESRRVTLYHAAGCHLCERAREVVDEAQAELGFELQLVDIGGDAELEARYRERLPVVEIDGEPAFTFFVTLAGLRSALA